MKKCYLYAGMLAAGMLAFSACSNDDDPISGGQNTEVVEDEGQVIRIAVANAGDGLTTKAGRPLFSSEAKQSIDKVKVYIVSDDGTTIATSKVFDNWSTDAVSEVYTTDGHGRQATWKLVGDERLSANNTYTAYAVGYTSQNSLYNNAIQTYENLTNFSKFLSSSTLSDGDLGEEIFAGSLSITVDAEGNIADDNVLTLHRQVAGTMGYFTSIPTLKTGEYVDSDGKVGDDDYVDQVLEGNLSLRLVASNISSKIYLDNFNSEFTEANEDNSNAWFVVNGVKGIDDNVANVTKVNFNGVNNDQEGYVLYSINLKDWFPNGDVNKDGLLDEADAENENNWNTPVSVQGASFKPGSVFAGEFLIPFVKVGSLNTLQLQLVKKADPDDEIILRTWNISLPNDDRQIYPSQGHANVWDGNTSFADNTIGETASSYSIVRNHLYSIGEKVTDEYEPGTDEPEDLSKGQNLILKVNDNWEMIHHMVVD